MVERLNEKRNNSAQTYLYKEKLRPQFSLDGRWASILAEYTRVAADVVALDSELPLKSRDTLEVASGTIPKIGMKLYLTEKQMKDVDSMIAQGLPLETIINNIFADTPVASRASGSASKTSSFPSFRPAWAFPNVTTAPACAST